MTGRWLSCLLLLAAGHFGLAGTLSGIVTDEPTGIPVVNAEIIVLETFQELKTDRKGFYSIQLPAGEYSLLISHTGHISDTKTITIADDEQKKVDFVLKPDLLLVEAIVVVGTRRNDRTVLESPVPIDILPSEEIEQSGLTETNQILEMLVPSFNFPRPTITDGTDHIRPATLRGLSPDQTLVLVNGKRRHTTALLNVNGAVGRGSSATDLNAIPAGAIDHIEVLRDGAAAQYGSDAIAGVINVVLKSEEEASLNAHLGETGEGDGDVLHVEGNYGASLSNGGFIHLTAEVRYRDPTNRSGPDPRRQYFLLEDGSEDPREATFDRINHRRGDAESDDINLFFNSSVAFGESNNWYLFGNVGHRNGEAGGFYRRSLDNRTLREFYPDGFLPLIESKIDDFSLVTGVKGVWGEWSWDWSLSHGNNEFNFNVNNSVNTSLGTASPTTFDAGTNRFNQTSTNVDLFRLIDLGTSTPFGLAIGAEFRRENYRIEAGQEASWIHGGVPVLDGPNMGATTAAGAQVFPGFRPADETDSDRDNASLYVDLEGDLHEKVSVGAAARFEDYSDFGTTFSAKLAFRFAPSETFSIRGAANNGFRAPSLQQSYFSTSSTIFISGDPFEIRTFPVNDPAASALGAEPLDAEESINLSAGLVVRPTEALYFTLDFYNIAIDDRIVLSENIRGTQVRELLAAAGFVGQDGGRYFTNAIDTETKGVEFVGRAATSLGEGSLRVTLGISVNDTEVTGVADNPSELDGLNLVMFGRSERARIEEGQPEDKVNLAVNYDLGNLSAMVRTIRFGEYTSRHSSNPDRDQTYGAKWITDLNLNWSFNERFSLTLGANNIFDVYPDPTIPANNFNGIFTYDGASPMGFNGVYYFTRINARFR